MSAAAKKEMLAWPSAEEIFSLALRLALVDSNLLAEGAVLQDNRRMTFSKRPNQAKQTQEEADRGS
jgi:hypothetical protein